MHIPQRLTFVTLGARDLAILRRFYRGMGWSESEGSDETFASFECGTVKLALHPLDLLRDEAAPGAVLPARGVWNGITLAVNFDDRVGVDRGYAAALTAGATPVAEPTERDWGGYSGYVADPEGNRWELAWAPSP